ncbi:Asp23/Gls24 family envelope stress response protein [Streptomyces johnsoniae]|uniref:Asp23/Gls24 family envelope stress response protein n=1 Tax=Streptomyces johnsoniae TaxID=3075532 RepID=A0ABU2S9B2_9ACTN|nr:Asp23/Gls24 family envelope stress response protein [Streptomyces sp. DSM 41886]MDT0444240.1 Asp23/Gls24 family envelope stress response protein [Streptomyces sp. DSM 41886]
MNGRPADLETRVRDAAAAAVLTVPGVAFLRPGLSGLLRGRSGRTGQGARGAGAVRVRRGGAPGSWEIGVELATLRGHRALDVTRSVRSAVRRAVGEETGSADLAAGRVTVSVTVTGIA